MKITVLTLFPEMVENALNFSIPSRAQKSGQLELKIVNIRDFAIDNRGTVDDSPYGGGPGMVLRVDVAHKALESADPTHKALRIMLSPDGEIFNQETAKNFSQKNEMVILCGRYEGFDARIEKYIDLKLSIGKFVLSGGEIAALAVIDTVTRLIPGVLGNDKSIIHETFEQDLSDYPNFTRPEEYLGNKVPEVLLTGHHGEIEKWRNVNKKSV
ncbi:tRNA (guanosine(37)-N1)-methyltransferase TrmD [Candidatus Berkelbacteria bacterium]|nr:tRNA (guanosine(37)-N1)-methyltransferase TrmD [Candidatus Berkelbacteria bacterium]